jgi:hypothetical protein
MHVSFNIAIVRAVAIIRKSLMSAMMASIEH